MIEAGTDRVTPEMVERAYKAHCVMKIVMAEQPELADNEYVVCLAESATARFFAVHRRYEEQQGK
jgi:hypothetical protein